MPLRREQVAAALKYLGDKADLRGRFERATSLDPQEQDMADIAVETAAGFVPGVGQALAARDVERARRANDPAGMAMASMGAIPGGRLAKLLKGFDPTRLELDVYHGTPHKFPATEANPLGEFDASKIGTGEGAQAYGHGIYLAESPDVGKQYQQFLASRKNDLLDPGNLAASMMYRTPEGTKEAGLREIDAALKGIKNFPSAYPDAKEQRAALERAREMLESGVDLPQQGGSLYKADLPDEMIDRMLDWDASIKSQPENVRKAVEPFMNKYGVARTADIGTLISAMEREMPSSMVSEKLRDAGIPGIKYLDAGSRGQGGSGTRNFVVFPGEEKKVRILERK
jgi:hypothetical protein